MGKDKKERNPADAFRKEQRKKEIEKSKKDRTVVKEVRDLLNDPRKIDAEIEKAQKKSDDFKLDKSLKDRVKELQMMKGVALKKQQIMEASGKRPTYDGDAGSNVDKPLVVVSTSVVRRAEDSIYYHPVYNQSGAPPPGQQPIYKPLATATVNVPRPIMGGGSIPLPPPIRPQLSSSSQPFAHVHVAGGMFPPPPPPRGPAPLPAYLMSSQQFVPAQQQQQFPNMMAPPPPPPRLPPPGGAPPAPMTAQMLKFQQQQLMSYQQQQYMQQQQQQSDQQQQPQQQKQQAAPKRSSQIVPTVDPLDPSGGNYTERFGGREAPARGGENSRPAESRQPPVVVTQSEELPPPVASVSHSEALMRSRFEVPDDDESATVINVATDIPSSNVATVINVATPLSAAEELMRRRFMVPEDSVDSETAGVTMPSAADLMRRRFLVAEDASDVTPVSGHQQEEEEDVGPSRPPTGGYEMYGEAYESAYGSVHDRQDDDEDDDCEDVYVEEGAGTTVSGFHHGKQSGDSDDDGEDEEGEDMEAGPLGLLQRFKMPVLNLTMAKPPAAAVSSSASSVTTLMGLLGGYGDDDDDDDEENQEVDEIVEEVKHTTPIVPPVEPRIISQHPSVRSVALPIVHEVPSFTWPAMSSVLPTRPSQPVAPVSINDGSYNNSNSEIPSGYRRIETATPSSLSREGLTVPVGLLKGPRIVKTDSAVTALVPNVLKAKRQLQRQQQGLPVKLARTTTPIAPLVNTASIVSSAVASSNSGGSLEDAYNSFLSEIGELGGLDE